MGLKYLVVPENKNGLKKIIGRVAKGHMNQPEGTTLAKPEIIEQNKEMTVADYTQ